MSAETIVVKVRSTFLFLVFSVVAGLLVGVLGLPMLLVSTSLVNTTSRDWQQVPLNLFTPPQWEGSKVYMADGSLLTTFADESRQYVPISDISLFMQQAQVAIEDHRFYSHGAIDPIGMLRAAFGHYVGETDRGASSITQQYVKMVRVQVAQENNDKAAEKAAVEQTISRKIIEMRYAMALEKQLTKDEILERYLNMAYYGDKTYGVESAAQHYFGVSAKDLDLSQAALIAGLVQSPGSTDPVHNPVSAVNRRDFVLQRMSDSDVGYITATEREEAQAVPWDPATVVPLKNGCANSKYPFICDYVKRVLLSDQMPGLGANSDDRWTNLQRNGFSINTVIDPTAQDSAQRAVSKMIDPRDPVIGVAVLIQPKTGLIVSMAQSRPKQGLDSKQGETFWNYAVGNDMGGPEGFQAGSTFKIFTIAAALNKGVPFSTKYDAKPRVNMSGQKFISCSGPFKIGSYSVRGGAGGPIDLPYATANSVNTYFIQLEQDVGICDAVKMAQAAGVKAAMAQNGGTDLIKNLHADGFPSFTLGTIEVAPLTMAAAFATYANGGKHCDPIMLASVTTAAGEDVPVPSANCKQTIPSNVIAGATLLMQGVLSHGTGAGNRIPGGYPQAGKSGTTDAAAVVAFGGFTPQMAGFATIAVDKKAPFWKNHKMSLGGWRLPYSKTLLNGSGGADAARIWSAAMTAALKGKPKTGFPAYKPPPAWNPPHAWTPTPTPEKPTGDSGGGGGVPPVVPSTP